MITKPSKYQIQLYLFADLNLLYFAHFSLTCHHATNSPTKYHHSIHFQWYLKIEIFLSKFFNGKITHLCVRGLGFLVFRTFLCFSRCWGVINVKGPKGLSICLAALVDFLIDLVGPWFQKGPIASGSSALGQLHSRDSFDFYAKWYKVLFFMAILM